MGTTLYLPARPWYGLFGQSEGTDSGLSLLLQIAQGALGTTFLHYTYQLDHGMICSDRARGLIRGCLCCFRAETPGPGSPARQAVAWNCLVSSVASCFVGSFAMHQPEKAFR